MAYRESFCDDEAMARRLQYEEQHSASLSGASPASRGDAHPQSGSPIDQRSSQERRDMELARQFAEMDMHQQSSDGRRQTQVDDPFDYSSVFQRSPRRHSVVSENVAPSQTMGHRRRNTSSMLNLSPSTQSRGFPHQESSFHVPTSSSRRLARSHSPGASQTGERRASRRARESHSPQTGGGAPQRVSRSRESPRRLFDADLELARKMQDLEDIGMGRLNSDRAIDVDDDLASDGGGQGTLETNQIQAILKESGTSMEEVPTEVLSELMGVSGSPTSDRQREIQFTPMSPAVMTEASGSMTMANSPKVQALRLALQGEKPNTVALSPADRKQSFRPKESAPESPTRVRRPSTVPPPRFEPAGQKNEAIDVAADTIPAKGTKKKKRGNFFRFGSKSVRSNDSDEEIEILEAHAVPVESGSSFVSASSASVVPAVIPAAIPPPPGGSLSASKPPPGGPPASIPPAPLGGPPRPRSAGVPFMGTNMCAACGLSHGTFLKVFDQKYHLDCFRCSSCSGKIDPNDQFKYTTDEKGKRHVHHRECFLSFGARCSVCRQTIPATPDGKIPYIKHPFFKSEQICVWHSEEGLRRCWSCHRFEPKDTPFVDLLDSGRVACRACFRSVIAENEDISQLWQTVLDFFENQMKLPVWGAMRAMPIFLVGSEALSQQWEEQGSIHAVSSCLTTSGLCLADADRGRSGTSHGASSNGAVIGIICLTGLPRDLAGAVLAHEATHAWLRMHPKYRSGNPLPARVEEGLAQLMSLLFLSEGLPPALNQSGEGPSDEKLRQFFKFTIEREKSEIFGGGFRQAAMAYRDFGIEALLTYVLQSREFPDP